MTRRDPIRLSGRLPAVDGLRTIAVLAVFLIHAVPTVLPAGSIGVDVFFVISGFVISLLLIQELEHTGRVRLVRFYVNRLARLRPALLLMTVCIAGASFFSSASRGTEGPHAVLSALYLYDFERAFHWLGTADYSAVGHTWSLAVEEQFYLLWPIVLIVLFKVLGWRSALVAAAILAALPSVLRILLWDGGRGFDRVYNMVDTRADQLLVGCVLALAMVYLRGRGRGLRRFLAASVWPGALALLLLARFLPDETQDPRFLPAALWTVGPLAIAVAAACVIGGLAVARSIRSLGSSARG